METENTATDTPTKPDHTRTLVVIAFALVYLVWGSTYLGIRVAIETLPPFLMAGSRFLLAGVILYAALRLRGVPAPDRREWRDAALIGFIMLCCGNGAITWAEQGIASNVAAMVISSAPVFVTLMDWGRPGGKRPALHVALGAGVGFAGMVWLLSSDRTAMAATHAGGNTVAAWLALGACLFATASWSTGAMVMRYGKQPRNSLMAAAGQMLAGGTGLLIAASLSGEWGQLDASHVSLRSLLAAGYLMLFGSVVTFSAYSWLVRRTSPAMASTAAFVNPLVALVLGWVFLDEALTPRMLGASVIILVGVGLILLPPIVRQLRLRAFPHAAR